MTKVNASIKKVANKIACQVGWDGMEAIVYKDGSVEVRKIGSFGNDEENIVYVISLEKSYWRDGLENAEFEFPLDIDNSSNWCDADVNDFAEYLIETELSYATDRHNGEELEWNED